MKIGFIGLGRMGMNMVYNLLDHKKQVVVYNRTASKTKAAARKGAIASYSFEEFVAKLARRKIIWLMLPAGPVIDHSIKELVPLLRKGDIIIDGGNSYFKDSQRRYKALAKKGIHFLDCGTSGGIQGARHGACMMVGGDLAVFKATERIFKAMCVKQGYGYMGSTGAGHFVKMVHNGIEYGMVGALNEGIEAIKKHQKHFGTSLEDVARVYAHGSIIQSRLASWLYEAFKTGLINQVTCEVPKGETEDEMKQLEKIATMPVLTAARRMRVHSRKQGVCAASIAAMRNLWGKHKVNLSRKQKSVRK